MDLRHLAVPALAAAAISLVGCASNSPLRDLIKDANENPERSVVAITPANFPNLGLSGHYEVFVRWQGNTLPVGKFRVTDTGAATELDGDLLATTANGVNFSVGQEVAGSTQVFVTIEPEGDFNPAPDGPVILAGDLHADGGFLSIADNVRQGLGSNPDTPLDSAGAFFVMVTPSDNFSNPIDNNDQGVHFVSQSLKDGLRAQFIVPPSAPNMELSELPGNLRYQAWVVEDRNGRLAATGGRDRSQARFLSMGTFTDPQGNAADSDGLGPQAGTDVFGSSWVGSDFVTQGPVGKGEELTSGRWLTAISIEPVPDNDLSSPFTVLMYTAIPAGGASGANNERSMVNTFDVDNVLFIPPSAIIKLLP